MNEMMGGELSRLDPSLAKAWHFLEIHRGDLAEKAAREGLVQNPNSSELHLLLAQALHLQGKSEQADQEAVECLRIDPLDTAAMRLRSVLAEKRGEYSVAEQHILEALLLDPEAPVCLQTYSWLLFRVNQLEKAERVCREALRVWPEYLEAHNLLALILSEQKKHRTARQHSEIALAMDPGDEVSHQATGVQLLRSGRPFAGRRHLREALRIDPSDPDVEEAFLYADRLCRLPMLPLYYVQLLCDRIPGGSYGLWAGVVLLIIYGRSLGLSQSAVGYLGIGWLCFCVYSWIAPSLTNLWIKWRPPQ